MNKTKLVIIFILLICIAPNSYAACKASISLGSECKGEEGYIYIPKAYKQKSGNPLCGGKYQIFKGIDLPEVSSVVRPIESLMFYQNLDEIDARYKNCSSEAQNFRRKDLFGRNEQEAIECLVETCMTSFNKHSDYVTGNEDIWGWSNNFKIISYEQIKNDLFAKIKVTK